MVCESIRDVQSQSQQYAQHPGLFKTSFEISPLWDKPILESEALLCQCAGCFLSRSKTYVRLYTHEDKEVCGAGYMRRLLIPEGETETSIDFGVAEETWGTIKYVIAEDVDGNRSVTSTLWRTATVEASDRFILNLHLEHIEEEA